MPLFGSKFSPKKTPLRKSSSHLPIEELENLVTDKRVVQLKLGGQELLFQNGDWSPESGATGNIHKTNQKLKKRIHELQEENNLLKVKYEIMLNMLTQTTAESHIQVREIEKLKKGLKK